MPCFHKGHKGSSKSLKCLKTIDFAMTFTFPMTPTQLNTVGQAVTCSAHHHRHIKRGNMFRKTDIHPYSKEAVTLKKRCNVAVDLKAESKCAELHHPVSVETATEST